MSGTRNKRPLGLLAVAAVTVAALVPADVRGQAVTSEDVARAVQNGVTHLRRKQQGDGSWSNLRGHAGGMTGLAVLALLNAGVAPDDPAVARGLAALGRVPDQRTYVVSLKCQAFAASGLRKYRGEMAKSATWLARTQLVNGMWSYGLNRNRPMGRGDNSNTQFALLGLHEAAKAGVSVHAKVWGRSRRHFVKTQMPDGGWSYYFTQAMRGRRGAKSYGSMTAAGVASLYICGQRLNVGGAKRFVNGAYPDCGKYKQNAALAAGIRWLTDNFSVRENPNRGRSWLHYYLYALERVGMVSGLRNFGRHDWYREGAEHLVATQSPQGSWGSGIPGTAFSVLFLAKGNRPVLIQKLRWKGNWNRNVHDLENFTAELGEKLGKATTWQTASLELPLADLRQSPILFITGHEFPAFTAAERKTLTAFCDSGGTLLFEACCGSARFAAGFRTFAAEVFKEYPLRKLGPSHPVFTSYHKLKGTYALEGIETGCRTTVFFSPRALSSLWELRTIPKHSELAFKVGTNIAAYATGREQLADKLDVVELPAGQKVGEEIAEIPRGAVRIARLWHGGDYNADAKALTALTALLRDQAKIDVVSRPRELRAADEAIYDYPVVFLNGHYSFTLGAKDLSALRKYLSRGGFLVVSNCCGKKAFDTSVREMTRSLFPDQPLQPLGRDHAIYTGKVGKPLGEVRYREILAKELKARGTTRPPLEAVKVKGRTLLIYSKYDWCCSLEGDNPYSCRGYTDRDGRRLAVNILLFAITH